MGIHLSGFNMRLLTDIQLIQCITILFGLINLSVCLFEDQIGKFDWKQNYVGQIKIAHFDTVSTAKKIILATEENVVAALNLKSGHLLWRQVLEKAQQGQIQYLNVDNDVVTVSGNSPWLVRGWDSTSGSILWEWSTTLASPVNNRKVFWFVHDRKLVQIVTTASSHLEITKYELRTGYNNNTSTKISTQWMHDPSRCVLSKSIFSCISHEGSSVKLTYINLANELYPINSFPLDSYFRDEMELTLTALQGNTAGVVIRGHNKVHVLNFEKVDSPSIMKYNFPRNADNFLVVENENKVLFFSTTSDTKVNLLAVNMNSEEIPELSTNIPETFENMNLHSGICISKKDKGVICRFLTSAMDDTVSLIQNSGKVLWSREESLSHITAVDLLDLPVSDLEASIETEFDTKEGNFLSMLTRRISSQINQLHILLITVLGGRIPQSPGQQAGLIRDEFGLHKIIVVATKSGKVFGIDNLSGNILWQKHLRDIVPFSTNDKDSMLLFVQRTTRHFPRSAQCTLVAKDKHSNKGVFFMFNPITGEAVDDGLVRTDYKIKQILLLPKPNDEFLRELLILDENNDVYVYPQGSQKKRLNSIKQTFIYTVESSQGLLTGYTLAYSTVEKLIATPTWQLKLGTKDQHIKLVVGKNAIERVHSQGRVLVDRSVLYKYVNPNLVAVLTHGPDPVHKHVMNIFLIDVVSGAIVYSISHKRAKEPIHLVHSENWLVYSYFNDKWRRSEIGTLELYEGKTQSNSTAFSSLAPPLLPLVEKQSYILPAQIDTMQVTLTEKGITSKHVLMALNNGGVIEMPWMFLDPRRPATVTPEMREEGVVPYIPELPLPSEAFINYNQSLARIRGIHATPSGLESTCLVLVHGLDIFYTRVAPSKTFDLLKDDFDYSLIVIVLIALLFTSYVSKQFASRKALKQAWK